MLQTNKKLAAIGVATSKERVHDTVCISALASIAYLLFFVIFAAVLFWPEPTKTVERTYNVRIGETIWHIANDVKRQGDVRSEDEIIWQIRQDNNISNERNIHAGDKITVWMHLPKK